MHNDENNFALVPRKLDPAMASAGWSKVNVGLINGDQAAMEQLWIALVDAAPKPEPVPATNQAGEVERLCNAIDKELLGVISPDNRGALLRQARDLLATQPATSQDGEVDFPTDGTCRACSSAPVEPVSRLCATCIDEQPPATSQEGEGEDRLTGEGAWDILVNVDDRTSPEEYPDMCLITRDELIEFMSRAATPTPPTLSEDLRALVEMLEATSLDEAANMHDHDAVQIGLATAKCRADLLAALARAQVKAS